MESLDREGGRLGLHHPTRPQLPWLGTQHPPHSLAAGGVRGTKATSAGEEATEPRSPRTEGPGGGAEFSGWAEKARAELDRPPHQTKRSAKPRHTLSLTHTPTTLIPNTQSQVFYRAALRTGCTPSGPIPSQPTAGKGHPDGRALPTPRLNSTISSSPPPPPPSPLPSPVLPPSSILLPTLLGSTAPIHAHPGPNRRAGSVPAQEATASETQTSSLLPSLHFRCPICKMNNGA